MIFGSCCGRKVSCRNGLLRHTLRLRSKPWQSKLKACCHSLSQTPCTLVSTLSTHATFPFIVPEMHQGARIILNVPWQGLAIGVAAPFVSLVRLTPRRQSCGS